jgi:hypothetical protein
MRPTAANKLEILNPKSESSSVGSFQVVAHDLRFSRATAHGLCLLL